MPRILIIDDDADLRAALGSLLESAGFEVEDAGDGAAGLAACARELFDVVILDLFMPGKEGIETLRELRRGAASTPVFVVSGGGQRARTDLLMMARSLGAARTFRKPVDGHELLAALRDVLAGRR